MPGRIARASPRRGVTALACAALIALSYHFSSPSGALRSFVPSANGQEASSAPTRSEVMRMAGLAVLGGSQLPEASHAESGVSKQWTDRFGDLDEYHKGGCKWTDLEVGKGQTPRIGDMVSLQYKVTAFVDEKTVTVDDTKGEPKFFKFGTGQLIAGMDEGIDGMKSGGTRKLEIPSKLGFGAKAVPAAAGRGRVPPNTDLEAIVTLEYIPGRDGVYEIGEDEP